MNKLRKLFIAILTLVIVTNTTSCIILLPKTKHDHGKHKGWYKKGNKPLVKVLIDADSDGKPKGKSKGKSKGKGKKH